MYFEWFLVVTKHIGLLSSRFLDTHENRACHTVPRLLQPSSVKAFLGRTDRITDTIAQFCFA